MPTGSLITPHVGEFDRLFGSSNHHGERIEKARHFAQEKQIYILLKGAYSVLASPKGKICYNLHGTPALAKAGSGDVLTGFLLALLAQYKDVEQAALMGMYIHARAAEIVEKEIGTESVLAHETADAFGKVCMELQAH
jgi:NAD(P)H-hydrate epimerase